MHRVPAVSARPVVACPPRMNYSKRNNNVCTCCNRVTVESNIIISPVRGPMKYQRVKGDRGSLLTRLAIMSTKLRIIPVIMVHTGHCVQHS